MIRGSMCSQEQSRTERERFEVEQELEFEGIIRNLSQDDFEALSQHLLERLDQQSE